jgi:hypothetical protein
MTENTPWACHVCGLKSTNGAGRACALCYQIACEAHLAPRPLRNPKFGHLELKLVCNTCAHELKDADEAESTL